MRHSAASSSLGKILYGLLFVLVLPLVLVSWSMLLDRSIPWPVPQLPGVAIGSALFGGLLMLKGMLDLYIYGHGLPMNAYPPAKFVTRGIYGWFAHPIYLGAVCTSLGSALWFRSSSGLYIVTPLVACMALSLLLGYERLAMAARFGDALLRHQPLFSLPVSSDQKAGWLKRLALLARIFVPWMLAGYLIDYARGADRFGGAFIPRWPLGAGSLAMTPYLFVIFRLLAARTDRALRRAAITGTVATAFVLYLYVLLPILIPQLTSARWSMTATHLLAVIVAANTRGIWQGLHRVTERVANSRHDWVLANSNFRIINHSLYSGLAGAIGVGISGYVMANSAAAVIVIACVLVGAAGVAQASWGSRSLLRPFGYWGGVLGGVVAIAIVHFAFDIALARIAVAVVLCATFAQAAGRLRCLAQGCCHGVATNNKDVGIRVWQPQSRVVLLSELKGVYIVNTQMYSILFNVALGLLLWSMWLGRVMSESMIVGTYVILTSIERFAEDAYRGEAQTKTVRGLQENQCVAIVALGIGLIVAALPAAVPSRAVASIDASWLAAALVGGLLPAFAMSMDFPRSSRRFSRLTG